MKETKFRCSSIGFRRRKTIQISVNRVPPYLVLDHQPEDRLGQTSPHHVTSGQQSCQNLPLRKACAAEENMSSAGLSANTGVSRLCSPPLHIEQIFHILGDPGVSRFCTSHPHRLVSPLIELRIRSISVGG